MPYQDAVGDIMRVTIACNYPNGQVQEVNLHYYCSVAGFGDSLPSLAAYADSGMQAHYLQTMSSQCHYYGTRVSVVEALAKWQPVAVYSDAPGTSSLPALPTQVRPLVSWQTEFSGPKYRGRSYMFTPASDMMDSTGKPSVSFLTKLGDWANYMGLNVNVGTTVWIPGLWHRVVIPKPKVPFSPFTRHEVSARWATQRRAGDYGRANLPPF